MIANMRVVIAPDSFKGSADAAAVAAAIADGWRSIRPHDELKLIPLADGGEGTASVIASAYPDAIWHTVPGVRGPNSPTAPPSSSWPRRPDSP
jgi:glycerate 2-kinase